MLEVPKTDRSQKISTFQSQVTCWRHQQLRGVCFHTSQEKNAWFTNKRASLGAQLVKNPPAMRETWFWSLGWKDPLEKGKATHSSILAWRTVQSMGSQRVGHDLVTFTFTFQDMEATWMTINRWTDKDVIHTYNGLLLRHKKERNWVICREVDGPRDYHTKWRKSGGERQTQYDITYMWNLTYDTRGLIYAAEMDPQT